MSEPLVQAYRAKWVFPVSSPPIRDGVVTVANGAITRVEKWKPGIEAEHWEDSAILPGLMNAHTHLEFSGLDAPLSAEGTFADWIRRVVRYRRAQTPEQVERAVHDEILRIAFDQVQVIGEIASPGWSPAPFNMNRVGAVVFAELLGLGRARIGPNLELAQQHLVASTGKCWQPGISPHAPYSVHEDLFDQAITFADQENLPVAFHLAETREELELLDKGTGPLREMLEEFGVWEDGAISRGARPLEYLERMSAVDHSLVIHGNYLTDEEVLFVASQRERMSVVYCPRTHLHFKHEPHPVEKLLAAGARVALGTDSKASNPDLSLLEEMKTVARRHPDIAPQAILEMGTLAGAEALGLSDETGTLDVGKRDTFSVVTLPEHGARDPHELLWEATTT